MYLSFSLHGGCHVPLCPNCGYDGELPAIAKFNLRFSRTFPKLLSMIAFKPVREAGMFCPIGNLFKILVTLREYAVCANNTNPANLTVARACEVTLIRGSVAKPYAEHRCNVCYWTIFALHCFLVLYGLNERASWFIDIHDQSA